MTRSHQITCAHDDCPEFSLVVPFQAASPEQIAADHRASVAAEGWTDIEGRDYCPDHTPTGATR